LFVGRDFQRQKKKKRKIQRSKPPLYLSDPVKTQTLADSWSSGKPPTFFHHPYTGQQNNPKSHAVSVTSLSSIYLAESTAHVAFVFVAMFDRKISKTCFDWLDGPIGTD
jgi:hypothetical protein